MQDTNKIDYHIFGTPKHNLSFLKGDRKKILQKIKDDILKADSLGKIPSNSAFKIDCEVEGYLVRVQGITKNGEFKLGTFYIPEEFISLRNLK